MQYYSAKDTSLVKVPSNIVETYIPLWVADGMFISNTAADSNVPGYFLVDGSSFGKNSTLSSVKLFTLQSNWSIGTQFAFECCIYSGGNGATVYAQLWDFTAGAVVSESLISTTSLSATIIRSGQFTLIPGRQYGITAWSSNTTGGVKFIDALLIVFG